MAAVPPPRAGVDEESSPGHRLTACLVEDQVDVRNWLVSLLIEHGVDVKAAVGTIDDGRLAVTSLSPDVAIVDNHLPDGRGIDLCAHLAVMVPRTVLILHTGMVSADEQRDALLAGVSAVVLKSIRSHELIDLLATIKPSGSSAGPVP